MSDAHALLEKIRLLPQDRLAEVENFVDFLTQKERRRSALDRLLTLAPALDNAGAEPLSDDDILADITTLRSERRARRKMGGED